MKDIAWIKIDCMTPQNLDVLIAKRLPVVMFTLGLNIVLDSLHLRLADGKRPVSSLPLESVLRFVLFVDPTRRVGFEQLQRCRDCDGRMNLVRRGLRWGQALCSVFGWVVWRKEIFLTKPIIFSRLNSGIMPRPPRIQFAGANYHVVTRGDGRRPLFHDAAHYERFTDGLRQEVERSGWIVLAFCWMPNHIHALIQTPEPNLSSGMQHWLSGYANWYAKRNRRTGHLYQGRYKAFLVEDAEYYWTLSRYIHLNPCNGSKPLADDPEQWPHSSFPGYARKSKQLSWIAYDQLHTHWEASQGGSDPSRAYRKYVRDGLNVRQDPFKRELRQWVFGSEDFLRRMVALAEGADRTRHQSTSRRVKSVSVDEILDAVASYHDVEVESYAKFRSQSPGRDMAAWLCRKWTGATLRELGFYFGLSGVDSVSNLVRRAEIRHTKSRKWKQAAKKIEASLNLKTEHKA